MGFLSPTTKARGAVSFSLSSLSLSNHIMTLPHWHLFVSCKKGTYFRGKVIIMFISGQMVWFVSMFLKPSHKLSNCFILPPWRLLDRHWPWWCHWSLPPSPTGTHDLSIRKYWLLFSSCVLPLSRGQPGFPFSGGTKQHSEKTEETQLNPNHAVFWWFFA